MSVPDETQARLDALEAHIAYQNQVIEELSDVAAMQWAEIAELKDRLNRLNNIFQEFEAGWTASPTRSRRLITERVRDPFETAHWPSSG